MEVLRPAVLPRVAKIRHHSRDRSGVIVFEGIDEDHEVKKPGADRIEGRMDDDAIAARDRDQRFGKSFAIGKMRDFIG